MERQFYIDLANKGLRMPIGTDLVLHEKPDAAAIILDGERLGGIIEEAAVRYRTPLAVGLMDLMLEKSAMLEMLGITAGDIPTYHFHEWPGDHLFKKVSGPGAGPFNRQLQAHIDAVAFVSRRASGLIPIGMTIGPFSLMTKLLADPITPVFMAGAGTTAEEDPEVALVEKTLELSTLIILRSVTEQIKAGAKIILIAEPAANRVYFSPKQLEEGADVYERCVMRPNRRIRELLEKRGVDLFFHCCGDLTDSMVRDFASLEPVILSLGSSRKLWEDASLVSPRIVLYGNLPTKKFYSDADAPLEAVKRSTWEIIGKMHAAGHPHILGSECDVLSVPGAESTIREKVDMFMNCTCPTF
ncbi:MAG: uroporphyrinogen decarboxylase family protein [bacterium]|nr:hypothetical protein [Candidatus Sumerlaeota bacterium]